MSTFFPFLTFAFLVYSMANLCLGVALVVENDAVLQFATPTRVGSLLFINGLLFAIASGLLISLALREASRHTTRQRFGDDH